MSAYRDEVQPGWQRSVELRAAPRGLAAALALLALLLFLRPWLLRRSYEFACARVDGWTCEVVERRVGFVTHRTSFRVTSFDELRHTVDDDGGETLRAREDVVLRVPRRELPEVRAALARLTTASPTSSSIERAKRPIDPIEPWLAFLIAPFLVLVKPRLRVSVTDEGMRIHERWIARDDIEAIVVTDEPKPRKLVLPRWSLVLFTRDGERISMIGDALLRTPLEDSATRLRASLG